MSLHGHMDFDLELVTHRLNIKKETKPVKRAVRNFRLELELHHIKDLGTFECYFIKPVQHSTWLTNIVLVKKKKNGHIHMWSMPLLVT